MLIREYLAQENLTGNTLLSLCCKCVIVDNAKKIIVVAIIALRHP